MNSLFPHQNRADGLAAAFVQRAAVCESSSMEEMVARLSTTGWSSGASLNLATLASASASASPAMANLETWEDLHALTPVATNYTHENMYKSDVFRGRLDSVDASTAHRQRRLDELPAPRTPRDVADRLGDTQDAQYPIYRDTTLASLVLDGGARSLTVWEGCNPASSKPAHTWNLTTFFAANIFSLANIN